MGIFIPGKKAVLAALLLICPTFAFANIGDTIEQLRERYGSAKDLGGQLLFEVRINNGQIVPAHGAADTQNHFTIAVYFDGIHSAMEVFTRNSSDPGKAEMSDSDVEAIKKASGGGQEWHPIQVPTQRITWVTTDKKLLARFSPNKSGKIDDAGVLVIMENPDK